MKHSGPKQVAETTQRDAIQIARGIQRPGQTKEQTRLIARGIEQGIAQYKRRERARAQELDRKLKRVTPTPSSSAEQAPAPEKENASANASENSVVRRPAWLPWLLLALTWLGIAGYLFREGLGSAAG